MGGRGKHALLKQQGQNNMPGRALPPMLPRSAEGTSQITELKPNSETSGSRQDNK